MDTRSSWPLSRSRSLISIINSIRLMITCGRTRIAQTVAVQQKATSNKVSGLKRGLEEAHVVIENYILVNNNLLQSENHRNSIIMSSNETNFDTHHHHQQNHQHLYHQVDVQHHSSEFTGNYTNYTFGHQGMHTETSLFDSPTSTTATPTTNINVNPLHHSHHLAQTQIHHQSSNLHESRTDLGGIGVGQAQYTSVIVEPQQATYQMAHEYVH